MAIKDKKFTIKIYDSLGVTLAKTLKDNEIKNIPRFSSQINGGFGELVLDLNLPFDVPDSAIGFMHIVRVYVNDKDTNNSPRSRLVYTGFISAYTPYVRGGKEGIEVTCLGLISLLSFAYFKAGASFEPSYTTTDPSVIMKAIIDHFNTVYSGGLIGYNGSTTTVDTVGTNVSFTFEDKTWFQALTDIFGTVGAGWWWTIDVEGQLYLKEKPTTSTHTFTIGKDIEELYNDKSSESIINSARVKYAATSTQNSDATSISEFGLREKVVTESQIDDLATANQKSNQLVGDNKDEKNRVQLVINSQYDIESIKVGDTCKVQNLAKNSGVFTNNMQIAKIMYNWDTVTLNLEEIIDDFGNELSKFIS